MSEHGGITAKRVSHAVGRRCCCLAEWGKIKIGQVTVKISQVQVADITDITLKIGHAGLVTEMSTAVWRHARQSSPANQVSQSRHVL